MSGPSTPLRPTSPSAMGTSASGVPTVGGVPAGFSFRNANIIIIALDALRPDDTTMFGYMRDTTPNLEKFAQTSWLFKRAYTVAPWTLPSFMSLFTGLYPSAHGVTNKLQAKPGSLDATEDVKLRDDIQTLPQVLHQNGYACAGFTGDAGVSAAFGFGRDFETYLDDLHFGGTDHSIPKAVEWLKQHSSDKPFFLFVHGYDVHGQYDPPNGYTRMYCKDYKGPLQGNKVEQAKFREAGLVAATRQATRGEPHLDGFTAEDAAFYRALYDEKIHDADERVGGFLDTLKQMGVYDRSIVLVLSDHGDEFMEHGTIDHGQSLYEELTHVLVMIHFPGETQPHVVDQKINSFDVMPTVMASVGVPVGHPISAVSLMPLLAGGSLPQRDNLFAETDYRLFVHKRSVRNDRYKYIVNLVTQKEELYDLQSDPGEHKNVIDFEPRLHYELAQDLMRWFNDVRADPTAYKNTKEKFIPIF